MDFHNEQSRQRYRWQIVTAAIRSGLRRYPRTLMEALRESAIPLGFRFPDHSLKHVEDHTLAAAWLGHASVLARLGDTNILVDPVFSDRVGMRLAGATFGPKRLMHAPVGPAGLPPIHLILITHAHYDHLDRPTLRHLRDPHTTVVVPRGTRGLIPRGFGAVVELDVGGRTSIHGVNLHAIAPAHRGARKVVDRFRKLNSYVADCSAGRVVFAGDTAYTDIFAAHGPAELAVFGIGAYDPREHMHATPEQVWRMFRRLQAKWLLPIHHSTFELSDEPLDEPMRRLLKAARGESDRVIDAQPGELWVRPEKKQTRAGA